MVDGHDIAALTETLRRVKADTARTKPCCIIARAAIGLTVACALQPVLRCVLPDRFGGLGAGLHFGVFAQRKSGTCVTFLPVKDQAQVDEKDVFFAQHQAGVVLLAVDFLRVAAYAYQVRVPGALCAHGLHGGVGYVLCLCGTHAWAQLGGDLLHG